MYLNGWTVKWYHFVFFFGLLINLVGFAFNYGVVQADTKAGLKDHEKRLCKVETKQQAIWETVRTQHVYDSLVAISRGDSMFLKAVDIVENRHTQPDTAPADTIQ